ncbi:hypothetical protein [Tianweitania sediminis]|uniref:Uncharacterized protein n=1 Tax=Tianweitania sediminis TaxID=1502156 RepID=A0A8J7R2N0_9HYPH|nr:hypothetical protein [Tianweitania sediminis]MBP0439135.1 hypothetical protein [Tianweitania sediminis]
MSRNVVCRGCGWASWPVSRAWAERRVAEFNRFFDDASPETQESYGGRSSLDSYRCLRCDGTAFRPMLPEDHIPDLVTISTVVCDELADDPPEAH